MRNEMTQSAVPKKKGLNSAAEIVARFPADAGVFNAIQTYFYELLPQTAIFKLKKDFFTYK